VAFSARRTIPPDLPAENPTEHRIEFRDSARLEFHRGAALESFQPPSDETCIEFSGLPREGNHSWFLYSLFVRLR
jgi:hypothetical protein